ncbi:isochorismatase family protein [Aggregatimonas sangjinii]|uniref:Isochorismatase family protein n=1 Tax=Aggregatimonas sangjinii TaxID=2583587 RepID=A0A5B7SR54_9FLAO|nr:isochorismatase family protein [Aggregatimonas sangjinii]QCW99470.1 isochorismatase family protein [Aggregatimonas sangjinii]
MNNDNSVRLTYTEKLTPKNSTFVMVDYLTGFDPGLRTIEKATFVNNATALAKLTEIFKMPTIVLGEDTGFRGNFYPLVSEHLENGIRVERHTPSAWDEPKFKEEIEKIGRQKIIVGGISLDICTQLLTLDLLRNGYQVYVVVDASGSDQKLVEHAAMLRMTQAGATMVSWGTLASELMGDWETPEGEAIGKLYQEHSAWGGFFQSYQN